jgi:Rrf2 family protein
MGLSGVTEQVQIGNPRWKGNKTMRVSKSTGYALLAVGYIARKQVAKGVVSAQAVSKKYDIPLDYLLKILQQLVRANVLRSKRGPQGGFWLAKPTTKITMLEIIEAVDGAIAGELNVTELAGKDRYSTRVQQAYEGAISRARDVCQKAKLAALLGDK